MKKLSFTMIILLVAMTLEAQTYYKLRYTWEKIENAIDAVKAVR
jgi:hypothetical protein